MQLHLRGSMRCPVTPEARKAPDVGCFASNGITIGVGRAGQGRAMTVACLMAGIRRIAARVLLKTQSRLWPNCVNWLYNSLPAGQMNVPATPS